LTDVLEKDLGKIGVTLFKPVLGIITIIFGILILIFPELLAVIVGIFLIIQGALFPTEYYELQRRPVTKT
jgi:uncharacterized membrane protein HdeD (DUF308 family)